jgi:hypothetical protein
MYIKGRRKEMNMRKVKNEREISNKLKDDDNLCIDGY